MKWAYNCGSTAEKPLPHACATHSMQIELPQASPLAAASEPLLLAGTVQAAQSCCTSRPCATVTVQTLLSHSKMPAGMEKGSMHTLMIDHRVDAGGRSALHTAAPDCKAPLDLPLQYRTAVSARMQSVTFSQTGAQPQAWYQHAACRLLVWCCCSILRSLSRCTPQTSAPT